MKRNPYCLLNSIVWKTFICLPLILLLSVQCAFAQETSGIARIYTQPAEAVIKLDGEFILYGKELKLDTGIHTVEAWIEGFAFTRKEFRLTANEFKTVRVKLLPSEEFVAHQKKLKLYRTQKAALKYLPIMAYAGYAALGISKLQELNKEANKNFELATEAKFNYNNGFWLNDLDDNKELYYDSKAAYERNIEDLNKKRTEFALVTGTAVAVVFVTWRIASKLKKPIFEAESKMHRFTFTPVFLPRNNGIHLTYQF